MAKTYFVYDLETGFVLSGFDSLYDTHADGYNTFTRPYKYPEFHEKDETCRIDYLFKSARREGLKGLKYENMVVATADTLFVKCTYVKNPDCLNSREARAGWWKLNDPDKYPIIWRGSENELS